MGRILDWADANGYAFDNPGSNSIFFKGPKGKITQYRNKMAGSRAVGKSSGPLNSAVWYDAREESGPTPVPKRTALFPAIIFPYDNVYSYNFVRHIVALINWNLTNWKCRWIWDSAIADTRLPTEAEWEVAEIPSGADWCPISIPGLEIKGIHPSRARRITPTPGWARPPRLAPSTRTDMAFRNPVMISPTSSLLWSMDREFWSNHG